MKVVAFAAIGNFAGDLRHRSSAKLEGADREVSNELYSRDFSDEKEIHSTTTSGREHPNTVGDRFRQRVRSSWFGGLLRWRARTNCHTESDCDRNACANSHPVSNFWAAQHSAPLRWERFLRKMSVGLGPMPKESPNAMITGNHITSR